MEFNEVISKRRTIRDFQNKEIPQNIVEYAIRNAFKAPTYNHLRDWDFIIINNLETKLKLTDSENLNKSININELEIYFKNEEPIMKDMYLDAIPKQKQMIVNAPTVIIVVFKPKTEVNMAEKIYDLNCLASVWTCIENFLLSLAEHDIYGVTYIPQNTQKLKNELGIPCDLEIASIIPIGYKPDNVKIPVQKQIKIQERIHFGHW